MYRFIAPGLLTPPRKTLYTQLLLAGIVFGTPALGYADAVCTSGPCVIDSGTNTLDPGTDLSSLTVSGAGTSVTGSDITISNPGGMAILDQSGATTNITGGSVQGSLAVSVAGANSVVSIDDSTVSGSGSSYAGVKVSDGGEVDVTGSTISGGMFFTTASSGTIADSTVTGVNSSGNAGVYDGTDSTVTITDSTVTGYNTGIQTTTNSNLTIDDSVVNSTKAGSSAILIGGGNVAIIDGSQIGTADSGNGAITVGATPAQVSLDDSTASSKNATATVYVQTGNLQILDGSTVSNDGTGAAAYAYGSSSTLNIDDSTLSATRGYALDVERGANVSLTDSTASSENGTATVYLNGAAGTINIQGDTIINTGGGTAIALGNPAQAMIIDDSTLSTNTGYALDIEAGSQVTFTDSTASSANSAGTIYMNGTTIPIVGDTIINTGSGTAIEMTDSTQPLTISQSHLITDTGYALDAEAGSNLTFVSSTASSANSTGTIFVNSAALAIQSDTVTNTGSGAAVYESGVSNVSITGSDLINTGTGAGLFASGASSVTIAGSTVTAQNGNAIELDSAGDLNLIDSTVTGGDIAAVDGGTTGISLDQSALNADLVGGSGNQAGDLDLEASNDSVLTGSAQNVGSLAFDASSTWNMTDSSTVNSLNLGGGTLQFAAQTGDGYSTLQTNALTGGGQIGMNTDLAQMQGDQLQVGGGSSGAYTLQIADHSTTTPTDLNAQLEVVKTPSQTAGAASTPAPAAAPTFTLAGGETDVGAYKYNLKQESDGWYLYNSAFPESPLTPSNPVIPINDRTNTVNATLAAQQAASSIWFDELQPLYARMGDLRMTPNSDGVWVRTYGSKERLSPSNSVGVDTTMYMTEVGVDHRIHLKSGSWYVGATAGSGNVIESFSDGAGSATATPTTLGAYATWASDKGWYTDFVLKYDSLSQRYNTTGSGETITADSHVNGVTASAETGMRFQLPHQWFIEPQFEVAALYQGGSNYTTSYGTPVSASGSTATAARMSVMVGHPVRFQMLSSSPAVELEPYANLSLIRQFSANDSETVAGTDFSSNVRENRAQLALGVSMQPVHNWQGFVELAYGKGQHYEQPWGFDVGLKKIW